MVEPDQDRSAHNRPAPDNLARHGAPLSDAAVMALMVVAAHVFREQRLEMALADHDHGVQAFLAKRAHHPLSDRVGEAALS
jgi:hypothetical protein